MFRFQHQAYIQKKLAEKTKSDRVKSKIPADLVVSRSQMDKMVEELVEEMAEEIGNSASQSAGRSVDPEDEPEEEWFEEGDM